MLKRIEKDVIVEKLGTVKRFVGDRAKEVKSFVDHEPYAALTIVGLSALVIFEAIVIGAADEVIGDLGGWD